MAEIDKKAISNAESQNKRKINTENLKKLGKYVGIGILSIGVLVFLFSGNGEKEEKKEEPKKTNQFIDGNNQATDLKTSYDNLNRTEEKQEETTSDEYDDFSTIDSSIQEPRTLDPIEEFYKQQELLRVQREFEAKKAPFKAQSNKVTKANLQAQRENIGDTPILGLGHTSFNPYAQMEEIMGTKNPNMQKEKAAWIKQAAVDNFVNQKYLTPAISRYEIKTGTNIPIVLNIEVNSDIPGHITAIVRENVYDSITGNHLLIPMGAKLFGSYNSELSFGQERLQVVFNRMTLPNGKSINLGAMIGGSQMGQSGLTGKVDMHLTKVVSSVIMAAMVGGASGVLTNNGNDDEDKHKALQGAGSEAGTQVVTVVNSFAEKFLNVQPTIKVPVGSRGTLLITKDLLLEPYNREKTYLKDWR